MEPITLTDATKRGGWFWFRGWVRPPGNSNFLYKGVVYMARPDGENHTLIYCNMYWLHPTSFDGQWWTATPPWENKDNA